MRLLQLLEYDKLDFFGMCFFSPQELDLTFKLVMMAQ